MTNGIFGTNVAAPRLRQTDLQPAAIPGSTYVRPQQREVGTNLNALASALGGLNSALQGYAALQEQKAEDPNDLANREWIARRQQMSMDQLRAEAANGTPDGIRARQDALDALLGERANADFRNRWLTLYNTDFDKTAGDMAGEYERMRQEFAASLPSEISRGNFYRLTGPHFEQWQAEDTKAKVGFVREQISTTVVQSFRTANDDMASAGKSAQERAAAIFAMSASNRTFLEMSGQEQNDTLFALAQEYALRGDEELVRELLQGTRMGADGRPLPPLSSIPRYTTDAMKLIEQAQSAHDATAKANGFETFVEVNRLVSEGKFTLAEAMTYRDTGLYNDEQLSTLVGRSTAIRLSAEEQFLADRAERQARLASEQAEQRVFSQVFVEMSHMNGTRRIADIEVPDFAGNGTRTITRQQQIEGVTTMFERAMADQERVWVEQGGMSPADAAARSRQQKLMWYSQNGIENSEWADTLNGIASRGTNETLLERGEISAQLLEQAELYRELKAGNPAYLSTMLTDANSKRFLEAYDNAITNRRMNPNDAIHYAASLMQQPDNVRVQSMLTADKTANMTQGVLRELGYDVDRAGNFYDVQQRITEMSLNNMTEGEIRTAIKSELENTTVEIHGMLVRDHRDLPKDFPTLVESELQAALEVFGPRYGISDVNDLYIVPVHGQSKWQIVSKSLGGMPIGTSYITPQSLDVQRGKLQREHDALVLQTIQAADAERAEYQRQYEQSIQQQREAVEVWRRKTGALSGAIADQMERTLNERIERDRILREMTPEKVQEELDKINSQRNDMQLNGTGTGLGGWSPMPTSILQ